MDYFVHPSSIVDEGAKVGSGTKVWHFSHISSGATIGANCSLGQNIYIGSKVTIGSNVKIQNNVSVYDDVILEDDVFCGPSCVFTNVINPRSHVSRKHEYKKTIVKKGATIGANATIVCGITLSEYAFIAAGAVVSKDVMPFELVAGVPAKRIGWMCQCGVRLKTNESANTKITCADCDASYQLSDSKLTPLK